jgi:hypothetical protein
MGAKPTSSLLFHKFGGYQPFLILCLLKSKGEEVLSLNFTTNLSLCWLVSHAAKKRLSCG